MTYKKVTGDVDAKNYGATWADSTPFGIDIVEITPNEEELDENQDITSYFVSCASYSLSEIQEQFKDGVLTSASISLEQAKNATLMDKALAIFQYGYGVDTDNVRAPFLEVLQRYTQLTSDSY